VRPKGAPNVLSRNSRRIRETYSHRYRAAKSKLPDPARQVAILVTGAHFRAAYEIYAHIAVAEHDKLPDAKLATIVAGQRPPDLTCDEAIAYDIAAALTSGGVLPELTYRTAVDAFGVHGAATVKELIHGHHRKGFEGLLEH
jgi:4-carboxymuconolactone decarboxylase